MDSGATRLTTGLFAHWQGGPGPLQRRVTRLAAIGLMVAAAGCQPAPPPTNGAAFPPAPRGAAPTTPGARPAPPTAFPTVALPSIDLPKDRPLYVCNVAGATQAIEFPSSTDALCRRHPEMGPCQYERNACRARGGRVVTARGEEVTVAVEAEYDKKVQRVRFQADTPPAKR